MAGKYIIGIDLQYGFLSDEAQQSGYHKKVADFLHARVEQGDTIFFSKFVNTPNSPFVRIMGYEDMQSGHETELFVELKDIQGTIVTKNLYTAWLPEIVKALKDQGADEVILFGLDTEACVLKTALDAFDDGVRPLILADLCASSGGGDRHKTGIELLNLLIGEQHVIDSKELV